MPTLMPKPKVKTDFVNVVKIIEVKDIDYIIHFVNTYNGNVYVFKVYKELFDQAMGIRKIIELAITITNDEEEEEAAKKKQKKKQKENMNSDIASALFI